MHEVYRTCVCTCIYIYIYIATSLVCRPDHSFLTCSNDLFLDCVYGIFIVLVSLITFVSVVWLKDQLGHGIGRNWFDEDLLDDNQVVDGNAEDAARGLRHERATETSAAAASGGPSPLSIFLRSQVDLLGEVQDTTIKERLQELWRCEVEIMHRLGLECLEYQDVLVSARRKVYNGLQVWRGALSPMAGEVSTLCGNTCLYMVLMMSNL